jgi:hypothetical protein
MARRYEVAGRGFTKVATERSVHVVEDGQFWKGDRSWRHRALCGKSITGTAVTLQSLTCPRCRAELKKLR